MRPSCRASRSSPALGALSSLYAGQGPVAEVALEWHPSGDYNFITVELVISESVHNDAGSRASDSRYLRTTSLMPSQACCQ